MYEHDLRRHVQHIAEDTAYRTLRHLGHNVHHNGYHDHADLVVNGLLRVEVKGALWTRHKTRKGRYQFNTRQHPDVYILYCLGETGGIFVIPGDAIGDRTNIAIWTKQVRKYAGQWSQYHEAWHIIDKELERCQNHIANAADAA